MSENESKVQLAEECGEFTPEELKTLDKAVNTLLDIHLPLCNNNEQLAFTAILNTFGIACSMYGVDPKDIYDAVVTASENAVIEFIPEEASPSN